VQRCEVLIVGASRAVGLALWLAHFMRLRIVDRSRSRASRAIGVQARTLDFIGMPRRRVIAAD
jgi:shikimate 5-dehydrogenase